MEVKIDKKRKAIIQALATLKIDGIYLTQNFLDSYKKKVIEELCETPRLVLKSGDKNGNVR